VPHTDNEHEHDPVPLWGRIAEVAIPVSLALAVSIQRDALIPPGWSALAAFVAAFPFLLQAARVRVPRLASAAIVLSAVAVLVVNPVNVDMAPFFLVYLTGNYSLFADRWEGILVMSGSIAFMVGVELAGRYEGSFIWVLAITIGWGFGYAVREQFQLIEQLKAAQADLAERAAADERQRIAREIHDVIAHSLAVTMLHLTGARLALQRDPTEAESALLEAERLGRESLAEIRRTVGLLAPEGTGTAAPMPTAADIPQLVREFESAGLEVDFELTGDAASLPPATGLALYRVAQESLSNVVRHAPGAPTTMAVVVGLGDVRLHVRNQLVNGAAPNADGGLGVRGMEERVTLLGGSLRAGPDGSGWCVEVQLPRSLETA
jgi:signal transduction histidine kinase